MVKVSTPCGGLDPENFGFRDRGAEVVEIHIYFLSSDEAVYSPFSRSLYVIQLTSDLFAYGLSFHTVWGSLYPVEYRFPNWRVAVLELPR